jgi:hypothetical protein
MIFQFKYGAFLWDQIALVQAAIEDDAFTVTLKTGQNYVFHNQQYEIEYTMEEADRKFIKIRPSPGALFFD